MSDCASRIPQLSSVQFDLDRVLPFHLVQSIFSYIRQTDALECLLVCQAWHAAVPQYTCPIWESVNFTKFKLGSTRLSLCLGPHVRHVILTNDAQTILSILIERKCCHVESIRFYKTTTLPDHNYLIKLLRQIGAPTLHFHKLKCEIPIVSLISAYPQLTDFSCTYAKGLRVKIESYEEQLEARATNTSSIIVMCLDVRLQFMKWLLSQCPKLKSFHLWVQWPGILNHDVDMIDLNYLFEICPRLERLKCYWSDRVVSTYCGQLTTCKPHSDINHCQLRAFSSSVALDHGPDKIIPIIRQHQQTLEALHINNYELLNTTGVAWSQLERIHTPQLKQLYARNLPWQIEGFSCFISQCRALCDLTLHELDSKILESQQVISSFSTLKNLRNFDLVLHPKRRLRSTTNCLASVLEVIAYATSCLERLCVAGFDVLKDNLLYAAALNKNLRILKLGTGDPIRRNTRPTTREKIEEFADSLGPHIQHLELTNLKLGSEQFLSKLAERKKLTKVVLVCCGKVSDAGLKVFLETKTNCLRYIRLDFCHVERHNSLITYCRDELRYSAIANKGHLCVSRA